MKIYVKIWLLILPIFLLSQLHNTPLPWSKITITSDKAHGKPQTGSKGLFVFTYKDNVKVDFIDKSKITSDTLEIVFDSKKSATQIITPNTITPNKSTPDKNNKNAEISRFKSIIFKNNVHFYHMNHHARADTAQLFPEKQLCKLSGNVIITQIKNKEKDVPVEIKTNTATINLLTQEVELEGNSLKPVTTIIELENLSHSNKKSKKNKRLSA